MEREKYVRLWNLLNANPAGARDITNTKPLLVHYTSMHVIESILKNSVLWLSNPLNMNDHQEVAYGIHVALSEAQTSQALKKSFANDGAHLAFMEGLAKFYEDYGTKEVKNLYVACFSEHSPKELPDGRLSMWRGYGDYGNGAAIAFDTSGLTPQESTPLILAEVAYQSNDDRIQSIRSMVAELAEFVAGENILKEEASAVAHAFFRRAVLAAIFTKHVGFCEEKEWRLVYAPDRDKEGRFLKFVDYFQSPKGLEPKLKLPLKGNDEINEHPYDFEDFLNSIIVGPRAATPLSLHATEILLRKIGREKFLSKLKASSIPFRA